MGDTYRVLVGINYPPDDKRAEIGDKVTDLPDFAVKKLLSAGVIEKYVEEEAPAAPVQVAPAAAGNTPLPDKGADGIDVLREAAAQADESSSGASAAKTVAPEEPAPEAPAAPVTDAPAEVLPAPAEAPAAPVEGGR